MAGVGQTKTASPELYISGTRASSWQAARVAARAKNKRVTAKARTTRMGSIENIFHIPRPCYE